MRLLAGGRSSANSKLPRSNEVANKQEEQGTRRDSQWRIAHQFEPALAETSYLLSPSSYGEDESQGKTRKGVHQGLHNSSDLGEVNHRQSSLRHLDAKYASRPHEPRPFSLRIKLLLLLEQTFGRMDALQTSGRLDALQN
jgi:hypothetical protein